MRSSLVISTVVILLVIIGGAYFLMQSSQQGAQLQEQAEDAVTNSSPVATSEGNNNSTDSATTGQVKEFTVTGSNFKFDKNELRVNQGDTVRITFKNSVGTHDFVLDEFDAQTPQIKAGEEATVEFVANQAGTFEYYCSVGQHRQMGMKGNLIVE